MYRVFLYELRRILISKQALGFLAILLFWSFQLLLTQTIQGVAHTAPFSAWSFASYLAQELPLISIMLLFYSWGFYTKKAMQIQILTSATPVEQGKYVLLKASAVLVAGLVFAGIMIAVGIGFLYSLFSDAVSCSSLLWPAFWMILPSFAFIVGVAMVLGAIQPMLILLWAVAVLLIDRLPIPEACQLFGNTFFSHYPLTLGTVDPAFVFPATAYITKAGYLLVGICLLFIRLKNGRNQ